MSSPRVTKLLQGMVDQIRRLGGYHFDESQVTVFLGRADSTNDTGDVGKDAIVIDIDANTWASNNRRVIVIATPASDLNNTAAMKTQSHASGLFLDGSVRWRAYLETPSLVTDSLSAWDRVVTQHLLGQLAAPTELMFCAHGTEPTVKGVNGAGSSASFTSAGVMLPYGLTYPGGV